jgi:cytochrome c oxidase assembly factor CtaG
MRPGDWSLDLDALLLVPALGLGYGLMARRFRPERWRVACLVAALVLLLAVFVTPLDSLAFHYLLSAHLLQNVVIAEWAPLLLVLSLPPALAARIDAFRPWHALTTPWVALPLWVAVYDTWHLPVLYDAALRHPDSLLHLEHATYLFCGLALWWPVVHGSRLSEAGRAAYPFLAFLIGSPLGLMLALLPRPVYAIYIDAPRIWVSALTDQQLAGIAMATEEAIVFFAVFAWAVSRVLKDEPEEVPA